MCGWCMTPGRDDVPRDDDQEQTDSVRRKQLLLVVRMGKRETEEMVEKPNADLTRLRADDMAVVPKTTRLDIATGNRRRR